MSYTQKLKLHLKSNFWYTINVLMPLTFLFSGVMNPKNLFIFFNKINLVGYIFSFTSYTIHKTQNIKIVALSISIYNIDQ